MHWGENAFENDYFDMIDIAGSEATQAHALAPTGIGPRAVLESWVTNTQGARTPGAIRSCDCQHCCV